MHLLNLLFVAAVGISLHRGPGLQSSASDPPPPKKKRNPLRESNNLGTQELEPPGKVGKEAGDARGPQPGNSTRSYPRRARGYRIYSWQLLRVSAKDPLRLTGVVGVCRREGELGREKGTTSSFGADKLY